MHDELPPGDVTVEEWATTPPRVRALVLAQQAALAQLAARIATLEARVGQHSGNSSKPPSSDPPSAPPPPAKTPRGKPKTKGAQPGHPHHERPLLPLDQVDQLIVVPPTTCCGCAASLAPDLPAVGDPLRQQVTEIPPIRPTVTEYQYPLVACPDCGAHTRGTPPATAPPGAFGPRLAALVALLHGRYRLSDRETVALLAAVFGVILCVGSVAKLQRTVSAALAPALAEVESAVQAANHLHVDETSWREGTKRVWLWVVVAATVTWFAIHGGRSRKVLHTLVPETYAGTLSSDRYRVYDGLPLDRRQLCWAHLIRNLHGWEDYRGPWQDAARVLREQADTVLAAWGRYRANELDRAGLQAAMRPIQQAIGDQLRAGADRRDSFASLCGDLLKREDALWLFVTRPGVEPTNNAAERALRPAVLWRKGSYGTQSAAGSRFVERMLTVAATCQQQQRDLFSYLTDAVTAHWSGAPAPNLLATP